MAWFNDLKDKFSKRRIRSLDRTKEYGRDFIDIDSAHRIGIIVNMQDCEAEDLKLIEQYIGALTKRKKELLLIELTADKKAESHFEGRARTIFIDPTKVNWLDYPTPAIEEEVQAFEMDILMDFDRSPRMASKYLCSMARAKTRTGMHREGLESCYELMINPSQLLPPRPIVAERQAPEEQDDDDNAEVENALRPEMKSMIKEFDYFLNMIDNGSKVKA
jgi:hypothetical protein